MPLAFNSLVVITAVCAVTASAQNSAGAAPAAASYTKVLGAVQTVSPDGTSLTVKSDKGDVSTIALGPETSYLLVPPGEKDLKNATRIALADVQPGDRVYARSRTGEGQAAISVIVMSKKQIEQHQAQSSAQWQERGAAGRVTAVDPAAKTIAVSQSGGRTLTVETDDKTKFLRYAADSMKFADAKPSAFTEVAPGNNLRVLGTAPAADGKIHAEEILSGQFRNIAGTIASLDPAAGTITLNDLLTKKPVTVKVSEDTNIRNIPPQMAAMIAQFRARAAGANGAPAAGHVQDNVDSKPGFNGPGVPPGPGAPPAGTTPNSGGGAGRWPGAGGAGGGRMDMNAMLERLPKIGIADLKPGQALIISSTAGAAGTAPAAINVVAGVEPILAAAPVGIGNGSAASSLGGMWSLDMGGLPQ